VKIKVLILIASAAVLIAGCSKEEKIYERGDIIESSTIAEYSTDQITQLVASRNFENPFTLEHPVRAIKIIYQTIDPEGNKARASGAIYYPVADHTFPIVSFHHGTETARNFVASVAPGNSEAGIVGMVMASMGYVFVTADYHGLGESEVFYTYLMAEASATAVVDMLRAAVIYCNRCDIKCNDQLFLTGYSKGGYVTMAAHREIDRNYREEFTVTASAPLAGSYVLKATFDSIVSRETYSRPVLISYVLASYNHHYKWNRIEEFFNDPYGSMIYDLFDGTNWLDVINNQLPVTVSDLLSPQFITSYMEGNEPDMAQAITLNELLDWTPEAPVRLIHGDADATVPYFNAVKALEYFQSKGKNNIDLITIKGKDHVQAAEEAIIMAIQWFEEMK
jgi:alpha-beta hydrolase superfamily lysophospholipase